MIKPEVRENPRLAGSYSAFSSVVFREGLFTGQDSTYAEKLSACLSGTFVYLPSRFRPVRRGSAHQHARWPSPSDRPSAPGPRYCLGLDELGPVGRARYVALGELAQAPPQTYLCNLSMRGRAYAAGNLLLWSTDGQRVVDSVA